MAINCRSENIRIENLGGTAFDGYLGGQLAVARALGDIFLMKRAHGDWHIKGPQRFDQSAECRPEHEGAFPWFTLKKLKYLWSVRYE
jgi:protein phosphatase PTC2/3